MKISNRLISLILSMLWLKVSYAFGEAREYRQVLVLPQPDQTSAADTPMRLSSPAAGPDGSLWAVESASQMYERDLFTVASVIPL